VDDDSRIRGGFYLKARCIQDSEVAHAPPHVREIWDWLIKEANFEDKKVGNSTISRGQCLTSYEKIRDGLSWHVGWRRHRYSISDCETAMKWLRKHAMLTTQKTTRGMIITIINYSRFQDSSNYENHTESGKLTTGEPQTRHTISKKEKNGIMKKEEEIEKREASIGPKKRTSKTHTRVGDMSDQEFLAYLSGNPAYEGIDIPMLMAKMQSWCLVKGKEPTRARLVNWLNREDRPIKGKDNGSHPLNQKDYTVYNPMMGKAGNKAYESCLIAEEMERKRNERNEIT